MTRVKKQMWAIVVGSSLLSSTAGMVAAERDASSSDAVRLKPDTAGVLISDQQFRESINRAMAEVAKLPAERDRLPAARRDGQDPAKPQQPGIYQDRSHIPSWLKYTLVGVGAAAGGYGLSQIGHHGEGGRHRNDRDNDMNR